MSTRKDRRKRKRSGCCQARQRFHVTCQGKWENGILAQENVQGQGTGFVVFLKMGDVLACLYCILMRLLQ